jgi:hypothetical protein
MMTLLRITPLLNGGLEIYLNAFRKVSGRFAIRADDIANVSQIARIVVIPVATNLRTGLSICPGKTLVDMPACTTIASAASELRSIAADANYSSQPLSNNGTATSSPMQQEPTSAHGGSPAAKKPVEPVSDHELAELRANKERAANVLYLTRKREMDILTGGGASYGSKQMAKNLKKVPDDEYDVCLREVQNVNAAEKTLAQAEKRQADVVSEDVCMQVNKTYSKSEHR